MARNRVNNRPADSAVIADTLKPETHLSIWHLIAGIVMTVLGIYVWFNPMVSLVALALYLGIVFIVVGAGYLTISFSYSSGWYMLVGAIDLLVGIVFVTNLGVTAESLPIIFALWCMAVGVIQLVASYQLYRDNQDWLWAMIAGALGIVFGFLILSYPVLGAITLTALMGAYIVLYGIVEIIEYSSNRRLLLAD